MFSNLRQSSEPKQTVVLAGAVDKYLAKYGAVRGAHNGDASIVAAALYAKHQCVFYSCCPGVVAWDQSSS